MASVENRVEAGIQREPVPEATIGALFTIITVGMPLATIVAAINVELGMTAALPIVTGSATVGGLWGLFHE